MGAKSHYSVKFFFINLNMNTAFNPHEGMDLAKISISKNGVFINMAAARIEPGASFQQHGIEVL